MRKPLFALLLLGLVVSTLPAAEEKKEDRWEPDIARFEAKDKESPPAKQGIVFIGSSSIKGWDLKKSFPNLPALNRGFGGSGIADAVRYADRIVIPYEPRVVVLYAGDNDLRSNKSPAWVFENYQAFVKKVHEKLPKTRIVYIGVKPSPSRWSLIEKMRATNKLIAEFAAKDERLKFIDVEKPMLGADGQPRKEIFKSDNLHMNADGYAIWAKLVEPLLKTE